MARSTGIGGVSNFTAQRHKNWTPFRIQAWSLPPPSTIYLMSQVEGYLHYRCLRSSC